MALIKCPHCGANISDRAIRCPKCGASTQHEQRNEQREEHDVDNLSDDEVQAGGKTVGIVAVVVLIVANIALAAYSFGGSKHENETNDNPMDTLISYSSNDTVAPVADKVVTDAEIMQLKGAVKSVLISRWSDTKQYSFDNGGMLTRYEQTGEGGYVVTETFSNGRIVTAKYEEGGNVVSVTLSYEQTSQDVTSIWMKSSEFEGRKLYGKDYYYKGQLVCRVRFYDVPYSTYAATNVTKLSYDATGKLTDVDCSGGFYYCQPPKHYKVLKSDANGNWTKAHDPSLVDHEMDEINCEIKYYKN